IEGAGAERVVRAAGHVGRQVGNALAHGGGRRPAWPLGRAGDPVLAGPAEAVTADADAILDRLPVGQHVVEPALRRFDDDRARLVVAGIGDDLALDWASTAAALLHDRRFLPHVGFE